MIKKYVGMLVASGLAGAVALACTITTGNGVTVPSEDAGTPKLDSGKVDSGKVVTADSGTGESDAGPACYKEKDAKVYVATAKAVGLQGKCTPAAAAAYITACFAPGTDATCMAWGMANEACGACIEGTNTTIGALIPIAGDNIILNGIACSYLTAGLPDCATKGVQYVHWCGGRQSVYRRSDHWNRCLCTHSPGRRVRSRSRSEASGCRPEV
jgi:hypothetical protein